MKRNLKRVIAIVLAMLTLLSCAGCGIHITSCPAEEYQRYVQDPKAYIHEQLGDNYPLMSSILAGPLGQLFFAITCSGEDESAKESISSPPTKENVEEGTPSLETQLPEENLFTPPDYNSYYVSPADTKFLQDYDWDYMKDTGIFYRITGYISHGLVDAKGKYKDAFRAYIKEFIVGNECRYALDIPCEEEKAILLAFLTSTEEDLTAYLNAISATSASFELLNEILNDQRTLIGMLKEITEIPRNFDEKFADLLTKMIPFVKEHKIEVKAKVPVVKQLNGVFDKFGTVADAFTLAFDVADCVKTVKDVKDIQKKAFLFFELEEIFTQIIENATNHYMREAAKEVWDEICGGYVTDIGDLIARKGVHAIIDITPVVGPVISLFDLAISIFPQFDELNAAYSADAVRHIKMACCEILTDYTVGSEGENYYYNAQHEAEVQIYILHCLQSHLMSVYMRSDGEYIAGEAVYYANINGVTLPENAKKYTVK